jgi:CheY-like chemotaxis protein
VPNRLYLYDTTTKSIAVTTTTSKILYADDDSDDRFFLNESIVSSGLDAKIVFVSNGQEAISYIEQTSEPLPSLVILDLNMPKMNGKETLSYLKTHPRYRNIPVIILSTSENKEEMAACAAQGALSYFVKPAQMAGYDPIVKAFQPYVSKD